ncbi:hypothetical protein [Actinoplanes sp. M2I2]|uniref:hypothetical protein n=1 Tax=Actinoplanes sp. M2I2 TaxID=1734444 RepID=UPI002022439A|nr:hypothetical protein [Actinoplanes sp. M2I2]
MVTWVDGAIDDPQPASAAAVRQAQDELEVILPPEFLAVAQIHQGERYPFEAGDVPLRGLIFHDEAWHWAMRAIHGDEYWISHPHFAKYSAGYEALDSSGATSAQ